MPTTISRRNLLAGTTCAAFGWRVATTRQATPPPDAQRWSLPIREPGGIPGNGFIVRHGFATENTWFNPGWWHTAEDWYRANDAETAGAEVIAVSTGEVLWVGSEYPGRVVLIQHPDGLVGMYGHLDYALDVSVGDRVITGQGIGRVLKWTDGRAPSHLHFEIRTFVFNPVVNGQTPAYAVGCGYLCYPGPGYWPIGDPRHPAELGYRNPSHLIANRMAGSPPEQAVVASTADGVMVELHAAPRDDAKASGERRLQSGERFGLLSIHAAAPDIAGTSALAYDVWYELTLPKGDAGWVRALVPFAGDTGSDGRPSSLRPVLLPLPPGMET